MAKFGCRCGYVMRLMGNSNEIYDLKLIPRSVLDDVARQINIELVQAVPTQNYDDSDPWDFNYEEPWEFEIYDACHLDKPKTIDALQCPKCDMVWQELNPPFLYPYVRESPAQYQKKKERFECVCGCVMPLKGDAKEVYDLRLISVPALFDVMSMVKDQFVATSRFKKDATPLTFDLFAALRPEMTNALRCPICDRLYMEGTLSERSEDFCSNPECNRLYMEDRTEIFYSYARFYPENVNWR